jgi:TolA-binding protein
MHSAETDAARKSLAQVAHVPHLVSYARLLEAQIDYAQGDLASATTLLSQVSLASWDGVLATESELLRIQVELDQGRFGVAESLASTLAARLPARFEHTTAFPEVRLDLDAWHASRTRATLAYLASRDVLRWTPRRMALAPADSILRLMRPSVRDTSLSHVTLLQPYRHAAHPFAAEPAVLTARGELRWAARRSLRAARALVEARARLHYRQQLIDRGLRALEEHLRGLEALQLAGTAHASRLGAYRGALRRQEAEWNLAMTSRLASLEAVLRELERGVRRLEARYPDDRSVRTHAETERARTSVQAARRWIAAIESLQVELRHSLPRRVADVLQRREPRAASVATFALVAQIDSLRQSTALLAQRLRATDAPERAQLELVSAQWRRAHAGAHSAREDLALALAALEAERVEHRRAQRLAYLESAHDAGATAAFLAATARADSLQEDAVRISRLEHAATALERFLAEHPQAVRADEMWYRLGETHLQRAAVQHRMELQRFLANGGDAADAPVPVEDYSATLEAYASLLERHPRSDRVVDSHYHMGFLFSEIGLPEISVEHLRTFLQLATAEDTRRGRAALRLGENLNGLGQRTQALAAYGHAAAVEETRHLGLFKLAWCAYDLDRHAEAREAVRELLSARSASFSSSDDLRSEALELMALAFSADHQASEAASVLDTWGRPAYEFALLRRMAQLFASRAQFDEAIQAWETLLQRHPLHPSSAGVADELLRLVRVREGEGAAHELAAEIAPRFAPNAAWSQAVKQTQAQEELAPTWQSRLVEEDVAAVRADSLSRALADPQVAAAHMVRYLRAAAVFAHQLARSDRDTATAELERAVELYTRTLEQFPGASEEPTTWLYLGEAYYELGRWVDAADAYGAASSHAAADGAMQRQAAAEELAALDAACAQEPQLLERYQRAAHTFANQHSRDARGVDALERVGELAFAAARYAQAEAAYTEVARRTPQLPRAAAALKVVGDTYFLRAHYGEAAERYSVALERARAAAVDSLVRSLTVLVPGALYRAAGSFERDGDSEGAARGFEHLAVEHPGFEYADQALYRAAHLRSARGDTTRALEDYTRIVTTHLSSALHPDAMLELAALQEARELRLEAARTYRGFANTHASHTQARAARLRAAELFAVAEAPRAADVEYEQLLQAATGSADTALAGDLWMRRARLAAGTQAAAAHYAQALRWSSGLTPPQRAEAVFQLAERQRPAYEEIALGHPLAESLERKKEHLEGLLAAYTQTLELNVEPWHAAASLRVGESLMHLGAALRATPAPPELDATDVLTLRQALEVQVLALEERAVEMWTQGLRAARAAAVRGAWRLELESRLYPMLAQRIPTQPTPLFVLQQPE